MRLIDLITPAAPPLCAGCDGWAGRAEPLCAGCRAKLRWLAPEPVTLGENLTAFAPVAYEGPARGLVRALKFKGAPGVADAMAAAIAATAPTSLLDENSTLVPIPLHPARHRKRGYNQAEHLAEALAKRTGATVANLLERTGPAATQVGRNRAQRLAAPPRFTPRDLRPATRDPVLLIDDVITTGATLLTAARALPGVCGALSYARTPGR